MTNPQTLSASTTITILAFAQARNLLGFSEHTIAWEPTDTAAQVCRRLSPVHGETLMQFRVAVDEAYASWDTPLQPGQTIAIIPPVSGG